MAYDEAPAGRVRDWPSAGPRDQQEEDVRQADVLDPRRRLTAGVYGAGLTARIGAAGMGTAVAEPVVRPFAMTGRPMREIIVVAADASASALPRQ